MRYVYNNIEYKMLPKVEIITYCYCTVVLLFDRITYFSVENTLVVCDI